VLTCTKAAAPLPTSSETARAIEERAFMRIPSELVRNRRNYLVIQSNKPT
jgi:hypothetical protein